MPHGKLTKQVLLVTPTGKRPRVPPRTRWSEYIPELDWFRLRVETAEPSEIVGNFVINIISDGFAKFCRCLDEKQITILWQNQTNAFIFVFISVVT